MKTVSLELAKQLKEAGYPQPDHEFWWTVPFESSEQNYYLEHNGNIASESYQSEVAIAAPTADEILEKLPDQIEKDGNFYDLTIVKVNQTQFGIGYETDFPARNENMQLIKLGIGLLSEQAAKMWLYLKKENVL